MKLEMIPSLMRHFYQLNRSLSLYPRPLISIDWVSSISLALITTSFQMPLTKGLSIVLVRQSWLWFVSEPCKQTSQNLRFLREMYVALPSQQFATILDMDPSLIYSMDFSCRRFYPQVNRGTTRSAHPCFSMTCWKGLPNWRLRGTHKRLSSFEPWLKAARKTAQMRSDSFLTSWTTSETHLMLTRSTTWRGIACFFTTVNAKVVSFSVKPGSSMARSVTPKTPKTSWGIFLKRDSIYTEIVMDTRNVMPMTSWWLNSWKHAISAKFLTSWRSSKVHKHTSIWPTSPS